MIAIVACAVTVSLAACHNDEADEIAAAEAVQPVDPRFVSAEALLAYFNTLNTQMPPDWPNLLPLFHIENDFQRKKHQVIRQSMGVMHELEVALWRQFNDGFLPKKRTKERPCTAATLKSTQEQRAEGEYLDERGKRRPVHLIKIGDRWWVSGYTLEYETDTDKRELVDDISDMLLAFQEDNDASDREQFIRPVIDRIRNGGYKDVEAARKGIMDAMRARYEAHRRDERP